MMEPANDMDPEMGEPNAVPNEALDAEDAVVVPRHIEALPPEILEEIVRLVRNDDRLDLVRRQIRALNRRWKEVFHNFDHTPNTEALCYVDNTSIFDFDKLGERYFGAFSFEQLVKIRLSRNVEQLDGEVLANYYEGVTRLIINERHLGMLRFWGRITHLTLTSQGRVGDHTIVDPSRFLNGLEALRYLDLNGAFIQFYQNMGATLRRIQHLSVSFQDQELQLYLLEERPRRVTRQNPNGRDHVYYEDLANLFTTNCTRLWFSVLPILRISEWHRLNPEWFRGITYLRFEFSAQNIVLRYQSLDFISNQMPALEVLDLGHNFGFNLSMERVIRNIGQLANLRDLRLRVRAEQDIRPILARGIPAWTNLRIVKLYIESYNASARKLFHVFFDSMATLLPNVEHLHVKVHYYLPWFYPRHNVRQYVHLFPQLLSYEFKCEDRLFAGERARAGEDFVDLP